MNDLKCLFQNLLTGLYPFLFPFYLTGQTNNGKFDDASELSTKYSIPFVMPDGIKLMTDVFLPIPQDCLLVEITVPGFGTNTIEFIPKGKQMVIYDSINGLPNPNPYQLPMIFVRTPYNKEGADEAGVISILGYAFSYQDMRGRYASEGVYLPIYSDGWNKNPYHSNVKHVLDVLNLNDPLSGNKHEDGYNSIQFILDSLYRDYDLNNDGITDTTDLMVNGRIAMFGGSALGYNQYQAAAARKIDPSKPGLKCLLPIVAPAEFYKSTGYQNGVFRDRLVTGWLKGQIFTGIDDDSIAYDAEIQNTLHTSFDYGLPNKFDAANKAIDHFVSVRYLKSDNSLDVAGYYPNSRGRADMDASRAPVNALGEGDPTGQFSRYTNMEVPAYHLSGWWDIFVDGQIETWSYMRKYLNDSLGNRDKQKLVIGPWAHQTIGSTTTGDITYPDNVKDIIGNIDVDQTNIPLSELLQSEVLSWFRYNMNYQPDQYLGEPKFIIHESNKWQVLVSGIFPILVRIPSENYIITFENMLAFINGVGGLDNIKLEVKETLLNTITPATISIPATGNPLVPGLDGKPIKPIPKVNFADSVPNVRFYVAGPNGDGLPDNANVGNYWFGSDSFPLINDISWSKMYLHQNGTFNAAAPVTDEGYKIYVHDPDDPILTTGGGNMIVRTPQDDRNSQGQMNLADPNFSPYTMNRQGVVSFTGPLIADSLCVIGFPVATVYAKSNPGGVTNGPTDTDFFIRVLDVYPDGREFFVVEGCVNARARQYARALVMGKNGWSNDYRNMGFPGDEIKDSLDYIPFSNIEIGQVYEYKFKMLPIAYSWGKNHRMKVLVSSSNYTRYQVNPNLPIEDGEFFRRKPGDGRQYTYKGTSMAPRTVVQRIAFSDAYPTNIDFPFYSPGTVAGTEDLPVANELDALVFPNPAHDKVSIYMNKGGAYKLRLTNLMGQEIAGQDFRDHIIFNVDTWNSGLYFIIIQDKKGEELIVKKFTVF